MHIHLMGILGYNELSNSMAWQRENLKAKYILEIVSGWNDTPQGLH